MTKALHPGRILRKDYLAPRGLSVTEAAKLLDVRRQTLNNLVNEKSGITPEMAVRLATAFGGTAETWLRLQKNFELSQTRSRRTLAYPMWVRSAQINAWANTNEARYVLPQLIRRLIHATGDGIRAIDFPAYEDTQRRGWDGVVESGAATAFVPQGQSRWELSTEGPPQRKADRDYDNRKHDPLVARPGEVTYVAVSARKWGQKREWEREKTRERFWAKVVAYDSTDIEEWLELAASGVGVWFARLIGKRPTGVQALEEFWNEFRYGTEPPMTESMVLAGRGKEAKKLREWLAHGAGTFRILADSSDEALAFLVASVLTLEGEQRERTLARTLLVTEAEAARQLAGLQQAITFGWAFEDASLVGNTVSEGHRVVLPLARNASVTGPSVELNLPRLGGVEFVNALKDVLPGETDVQKLSQAEEIARKSGRSLTVYRRLNASAGVASPPDWAKPDEAASWIPVLLADSWSEANEADKSVVSKLAGTQYTAVARLVSNWSHRDGPVRRIGDIWALTAPLDAWSVLAKFITDGDLAEFEQIALEVLGEDDPALDEVPERRWLTEARGPRFRFSAALRSGLAHGLALLGAVADEAGLQAHPRGADAAFLIVRTLLEKQTSERRWASASDVLTHLAEASPDAFLDALEASLRQRQPDVMALFEEEDAPIAGRSRHTNLMWALEMLAWYPEYLGRAASALAKLARLDPGGRLTNRPSQSLGEIFCSWNPNTAASLTERLNALDRLLTLEPDAGWKLLLVLLPKLHDFSTPTAEPLWRPKPERGPVTRAEVWRANRETIQRAMNAAGLDHRRLAELIPGLASWPPDQLERLREQLRAFAGASHDASGRTHLWRTIRDFLHDHRRVPGADWALPEEELTKLEAVAGFFEPDDILEQQKWLFDDYHPRAPKPSQVPFEEQEAQAAEMRREGLSSVLGQLGIEGVLELARRTKQPNLVGWALGELQVSAQQEAEILELTVGHDDPAVRTVGRVFVLCRHDRCDDTWASEIIGTSMFEMWPVAKRAQFCLGLLPRPSTWRIVSSLDRPLQEHYWAEANVWLRPEFTNEEAEYAISRLLEAGRALDAVELASFNEERLAPRTLLGILDAMVEQLATTKDPRPRGNFVHNLQTILNRLRKSPEASIEEVGRIEFSLLPLLHPLYPPEALNRLVCQNPKLFAEVVACAFKPDTGESEPLASGETDDLRRAKVSRAWSLLQSCSRVPGTEEDGTLTGQKLTDWFRMARAECSAMSRSVIGDHEIGRLLARAPKDPDGIWPHAAVRDLIEEANSSHLEEGICVGHFNARGGTWRLPFDGGVQERALSSQYREWAKALGAHWVRTAHVLTQISRMYEDSGRHYDELSERLDLPM